MSFALRYRLVRFGSDRTRKVATAVPITLEDGR